MTNFHDQVSSTRRSMYEFGIDKISWPLTHMEQVSSTYVHRACKSVWTDCKPLAMVSLQSLQLQVLHFSNYQCCAIIWIFLLKKKTTWIIFNNIPDSANHQFLVLLKNQNQGIADSGYFKNLEELCILMKEPVVYLWSVIWFFKMLRTMVIYQDLNIWFLELLLCILRTTLITFWGWSMFLITIQHS